MFFSKKLFIVSINNSEISARFTKAQQDRYDAYRQSKLPRTAVKRQMQSAGVSSVNDTWFVFRVKRDFKIFEHENKTVRQ